MSSEGQNVIRVAGTPKPQSMFRRDTLDEESITFLADSNLELPKNVHKAVGFIIPKHQGTFQDTVLITINMNMAEANEIVLRFMNNLGMITLPKLVMKFGSLIIVCSEDDPNAFTLRTDTTDVGEQLFLLQML